MSGGKLEIRIRQVPETATQTGAIDIELAWKPPPTEGLNTYTLGTQKLTDIPLPPPPAEPLPVSQTLYREPPARIGTAIRHGLSLTKRGELPRALGPKFGEIVRNTVKKGKIEASVLSHREKLKTEYGVHVYMGELTPGERASGLAGEALTPAEQEDVVGIWMEKVLQQYPIGFLQSVCGIDTVRVVKGFDDETAPGKEIALVRPAQNTIYLGIGGGLDDLYRSGGDKEQVQSALHFSMFIAATMHTGGTAEDAFGQDPALRHDLIEKMFMHQEELPKYMSADSSLQAEVSRLQHLYRQWTRDAKVGVMDENYWLYGQRGHVIDSSYWARKQSVYS